METLLGVEVSVSDMIEAEWSLIRIFVGLAIVVVLAGAGAGPRIRNRETALQVF